MADWVVIASYGNIHEASEALSLLQVDDIWCDLKDQNLHGFMKPFDIVGSDVKLIVKETDSTKAIQLLVDAGLIKISDLGPNKANEWLNKLFRKIGLIHK